MGGGHAPLIFEGEIVQFSALWCIFGSDFVLHNFDRIPFLVVYFYLRKKYLLSYATYGPSVRPSVEIIHFRGNLISNWPIDSKFGLNVKLFNYYITLLIESCIYFAKMKSPDYVHVQSTVRICILSIDLRVSQHVSHNTCHTTRVSQHVSHNTSLTTRVSQYVSHNMCLTIRVSQHVSHNTSLTTRVSQHVSHNTCLTIRVSQYVSHICVVFR